MILYYDLEIFLYAYFWWDVQRVPSFWAAHLNFGVLFCDAAKARMRTGIVCRNICIWGTSRRCEWIRVPGKWMNTINIILVLYIYRKFEKFAIFTFILSFDKNPLPHLKHLCGYTSASLWRSICARKHRLDNVLPQISQSINEWMCIRRICL